MIRPSQSVVVTPTALAFVTNGRFAIVGGYIVADAATQDKDGNKAS
jgi:hypothetical protein